jgi:hypothetical protein
VAELSELKVQITLTVTDLRDLVALMNLAAEHLPEDEVPELVDDISEQYFDLMENLDGGFLGDFEPE